MLGVLAGGIAHDFNSLLTGIHERLDAAVALLPDNHPARVEIARVHEALAPATDLARRVLTLGRNDAGRACCEPATLVAESLPLLRSSLPCLIELRSNVVQSPGCVGVSARQFQQVLFNLGLNAAQAIGPGAGIIEVGMCRVPEDALPVMDVGTAGNGPHFCLSVSDTGGGTRSISRAQESAPPFTSMPGAHGAGLGLAIVRSIVLQHQGSIAIEATPGEGTTFRVYFPEISPSPSSRVTAAAARVRSRQVHIAIVDDEDTVVRLATQALEFSGYRATEIASADDCLTRVLRNPAEFDLIITDQRLPTMSGTDLVSRLREQGVQTPVLVTSGSHASTTLTEIATIAPARFLAKPFTLVDLLGAVQELLSGR